MEHTKQQYQKPALIDQGSVVTKTMATQCGGCWDGSPDNNDDTTHCDDTIQLQ